MTPYPFSTSDETSTCSEDDTRCEHCRQIRDNAKTVQYILKVLDTRKHLKGTQLRCLIHAANEILMSVMFPVGKCCCNSLN